MDRGRPPTATDSAVYPARRSRIEVDEAALNQEVAHLEHVAPPAAVADTGAPGAIHVQARARALAREHIGAGHHPVERRVVVQDVAQQAAEVGKELADLLLASGESPLREEHLGIVGKQIENAAAPRRHPLVVERLQVFEGHGLALLVGHRHTADRHLGSSYAALGLQTPLANRRQAGSPDRAGNLRSPAAACQTRAAVRDTFGPCL